ncbi:MULTISPECIES: hypothetical protein [Nostocales]
MSPATRAGFPPGGLANPEGGKQLVSPEKVGGSPATTGTGEPV